MTIQNNPQLAPPDHRAPFYLPQRLDGNSPKTLRPELTLPRGTQPPFFEQTQHAAREVLAPDTGHGTPGGLILGSTGTLTVPLNYVLISVETTVYTPVAGVVAMIGADAMYLQAVNPYLNGSFTI